MYGVAAVAICTLYFHGSPYVVGLPLLLLAVVAKYIHKFTLTTSVGQTRVWCITQLAKMSTDPKFIELTDDSFGSC